MINNKYLDWQPIVNSIANSNELTILEFGCGAGTAFLLDKFKFVYSYETNSRDLKGDWFRYTANQNSGKNWKGYFDTDFPGINVDCVKFKENVLKTIDISDIDVLFVDPGFAQRAACMLEFANLLHFKYMFVHDTQTEPRLYNWPLLNSMPSQYTLHDEIITGQGVKLWKLNNI
jgi:hypothetical protein